MSLDRQFHHIPFVAIVITLSFLITQSSCASSSSSSGTAPSASALHRIDKSHIIGNQRSTGKLAGSKLSSHGNNIDNIIVTMTDKQSHNGGGIATRLARKNILELQPYRCARDDYSEGVLLDANENAFGPTSLPTNSLNPYDNSNSLERYPDPYQMALKELYAKYRGYNLTPSNIFVGVGSDEAIDLLMRIFCQPGGDDNILITPPTYGMYKVCAKVNDVPVFTAPLTPDFDLEIPKVRNPFECDHSVIDDVHLIVWYRYVHF
jgi:hypothetical protein